MSIRIPSRNSIRTGLGILLSAICATTAVMIWPHARAAAVILGAQDDPAALSDAQLRTTARPEPARIEREIDEALASGDVGLASSFVELARSLGIPLSDATLTRVDTAVAEANTTAHMARQFATGLVTGNVTDGASLSGTLAGDLFVFGDIRDIVREGKHFAAGEQVDRFVLALACVGVVVTAGTFASVGLAAPARAGLTMVKDARRAGRLSAGLGEWAGRSAREVVDAPMLRNAVANASLAEPGPAIRAIKAAVRMDKAGEVIAVAKDVGRVGEKAGARAAVDALKIAEGPRDVARAARLAAAKGGATRAIIKILGRGALVLAAGALDLASWLFAVVLTLFGLVCSLKATTERLALAFFRHRRLRRQRMLAAA